MSAQDERLTLSVAFSLCELCLGLGGQVTDLFAGTDELIAALDDRQVHILVRKLAGVWL